MQRARGDRWAILRQRLQREQRAGFHRFVRAAWRGRYNRTRNRKDGIQRGPASAWAADQYRLGKRAEALSFLHAEVKRGHLKARFVKNLATFLKKRGY